MMTSDLVLKALDKPRTLAAILRAVDPAGKYDTLQDLLVKMRERGQVRFDIRKGVWSRF